MVDCGRLRNPGCSLYRGGQKDVQMLTLESSSELAEEDLHFVTGLLQVRGSPARSRRRVVQLVRQPSRHCAKRDQLFTLVRVAFHVAHPCRRSLKDLPRNGVADRQHPPEVFFVEPKKS